MLKLHDLFLILFFTYVSHGNCKYLSEKAKIIEDLGNKAQIKVFKHSDEQLKHLEEMYLINLPNKTTNKEDNIEDKTNGFAEKIDNISTLENENKIKYFNKVNTLQYRDKMFDDEDYVEFTNKLKRSENSNSIHKRDSEDDYDNSPTSLLRDGTNGENEDHDHSEKNLEKGGNGKVLVKRVPVKKVQRKFRNLFDAYKRHYGKKYRNRQEEEKSFDIFRKNIRNRLLASQLKINIAENDDKRQNSRNKPKIEGVSGYEDEENPEELSTDGNEDETLNKSYDQYIDQLMSNQHDQYMDDSVTNQDEYNQDESLGKHYDQYIEESLVNQDEYKQD